MLLPCGGQAGVRGVTLTANRERQCPELASGRPTHTSASCPEGAGETQSLDPEEERVAASLASGKPGAEHQVQWRVPGLIPGSVAVLGAVSGVGGALTSFLQLCAPASCGPAPHPVSSPAASPPSRLGLITTSSCYALRESHTSGILN